MILNTLVMIFNEIKCHVSTFLGLVGDASPASPPVSAPDSELWELKTKALTWESAAPG